jgi:hypothetical protein
VIRSIVRMKFAQRADIGYRSPGSISPFSYA